MKSPSTWFAFLAVAALVGLGFVLDADQPAADAVADAAAEPVRVGLASAGAWYCAAGNTSEGSQVRVVAAATPERDDQPAAVTLDTFASGVTVPGEETEVFSGSSYARVVEPDRDEVGIRGRWWDAPVAITRLWSVRGGDLPDGEVEGPCEPDPSASWVIPGMATAGGADARLYLANPFETDASVTITFTTPEGPIDPKRLENVAVPKRSVQEIRLNDFAAQEPDLGVVITSRSGRVVVEGVQGLNAAIGDIDGLSLVKAARSTAESWTIPWYTDQGDESASWLWVSNVEERPASVSLTVHTEAGGVVPSAIEELTVGPGEVRRFDLRELDPEGRGSAGLTVRSDNGVPIVAAVASTYTGPTEERTGISVQLGAPEPDDTWVLTVGGTENRETRLDLANPGATAAVLDVQLWGAEGVTNPPELTNIQVPAGAAGSLDLTPYLSPGEDATAFVIAREGSVVAGRHSSAIEGRRRLAASLGIPGNVWQGGQLVPPVRFESGLPQRIDTDQGPRNGDPLDPETPIEAGVPSASPSSSEASGDPSPAPGASFVIPSADPAVPPPAPSPSEDAGTESSGESGTSSESSTETDSAGSDGSDG